jgi:DNA invertase Pin-like site-specific DNA recombinase
MPFADSFMIGIMAQVAHWEREQISKRTKAALKVAKARGAQLGGDRGNLPQLALTAANASVERRQDLSRTRRAKILPHVREAQTEGFRSLRTIAGYLNRKGIRTSRGAQWTATAVSRVMAPL